MPASFPLLVEWSPGSVRLVDPATGKTTRGATIADCLPELGRDVVIAVGRRSAFVRALPVPAGSRADVARIVGLGLLASIPLEPNEIVSGYRLSEDRRIALVGAMRAESLVRLYAESQAAGLRVKAVLPVAFGSWLAARSRALASCAVVGLEDGALNIDVVDGGELVYSRVVPTTTPEADADDEVVRSLATAGVAPAPVLALGAPEIAATVHDPKEALLHLADLGAIDRLLFNLELPARREARLARAQRWRVQRALFVAGLALATGAYAYTVRVRASKPLALPKGLDAAVKKARSDKERAAARLDEATGANRILDVAFGPAQTTSDVVAALANGVPADAWITALAVARGRPASVAGYATHSKDIGAFFNAVSKNPRFHGMQVVATNVATVGKTPVVQFLLSGDAVGTASFDRPLPRVQKTAKAQSTRR